MASIKQHQSGFQVQTRRRVNTETVTTIRNHLGPAAITLIYAAFAAVWIVASGSLLYLSVSDPIMQGRIEIAKGLGFVAVSSGLLFLLLRARWKSSASVVSVALDEAPLGERSRLAFLILILVLMVPIIGFAVFSLNVKNDESKTFNELGVIAGYKARQIEQWLEERRSDAETLARSRGFIERVQLLQKQDESWQRSIVTDRLNAMRQAYAYDSTVLLDTEDRPMLATGEMTAIDPHTAKLARKALASGNVQMSELHQHDGKGHLSFAAPLFSKADRQPVGTVLMHLDPQTFLFPLVQSWPTDSHSGETLLVRREGAEVLYLSELKQRKGSALKLRAAIDDPQLAGAIALHSMKAGRSKGVDYRAATVLAAWQPIAGTDWQLVAKLDREEAIAPAKTAAWWATMVALLAAIMVATAVFLLVRQQRTARQLAMQVETDRLFRLFYDLPFIGMTITTPGTGRQSQFNDYLCTMLGYTREELATNSWRELIHPDDLNINLAVFNDMMAGNLDEYVTENRLVRKDGSVLFANIVVKCIRQSGRIDYLAATVQDITERKAAEASIHNLDRLYLTLSRCNTAIVRCKTETELFSETCRIAVEAGDMKMAWVGMADPETGVVRPVASYGENHREYLDRARITVNADDPNGRGPTGTAIREGSPFWCQDFLNDPRTEPWHELGTCYGWGASSSLPLSRGGRTIGALTLYMTKPMSFDQQTRNLLTEVASDISFALDNFDREEARQNAEENLRGSEERYRLLFDNSLDAILLTDPDGPILAANAAACRIFGCSEQVLLTGGRDIFVDPSDPVLKKIREERARTGKFIGEVSLRRSNGEAFSAEISTSLFRKAGGELRTSIIIRDITERKAAEAKLVYLAQYDVLTNLPNRMLLSDRLGIALAQTERSGKQLALMYLDIDRFKKINDSLGHEFGDQLLREVALRLKGAVRAADTVSRQGGDEFIVVLSEIDNEQDAARVAEKLIAAIAEPYTIDGTDLVLTASIGIACFPDNGRNAEVLLRNADAALYVAKGKGRNRYQFYSAEMNARSHERLVLESELRRAIERNQLFVVYQPQVELGGDNRIVGVEALVRWRHPTQGVIPPDQFIAIVEESGLIAAIGIWVLETACCQHAAWVAEGLRAGSIAVNVSAYQFSQGNFVDSVATALNRSLLQPGLLELEVTESVVMRGIDEVQQKLDALSDLGVKLAIDDFGTGYSSLSYLKQFPLHRLKIDKSFIRGLPDDRQSAGIAKAIISMGHSLGLNVLAEGIETDAQADYLRLQKCDFGQGYLYARPMPADEYSAYLRLHARPAGTGQDGPS